MKSMIVCTLAVLTAAATGPVSASAPATGSAPVEAASGDALVIAYDAVRAALASDNLATARKTSGALAASARAAGAGPQVSAVATRAAEVRDAADLAGARLAFGELSRALIGLLVAEPARATGVTAYRCPMAKGYQKWVQLGGSLANPYMGKKMLTCGAKTPLAV